MLSNKFVWLSLTNTWYADTAFIMFVLGAKILLNLRSQFFQSLLV